MPEPQQIVLPKARCALSRSYMGSEKCLSPDNDLGCWRCGDVTASLHHVRVAPLQNEIAPNSFNSISEKRNS